MSLNYHAKTSRMDVRIEALSQVRNYSTRSDFFPGTISVPTMTIEGLSPLTGLFGDEGVVLTLPISEDLEFFQSLSAPGSVYSSRVIVVESTTSSDGVSNPTKTVLFDGEIAVVVQSPKGKPGLIALELKSLKAATNVPAGIPNGETCSWVVGKGFCTVNLALFTFSVTILSIDNDNLQVIASGGPGSPDGLFTRGFLEYEGIQVGVRYWSSASPSVFYTSRQMPDSWIGKTVKAVAGCDNRIQTCRTVFNNEKDNSAMGISAVDYNPSLESGG